MAESKSENPDTDKLFESLNKLCNFYLSGVVVCNYINDVLEGLKLEGAENNSEIYEQASVRFHQNAQV